jgi:hypothetical protein
MDLTALSKIADSANLKGRSYGMSLEDIAKKHKLRVSDLEPELKMGKKIEMEHTEDVKVSERIAMDHLFDDPKYYTHLMSQLRKYEPEDYK